MNDNDFQLVVRAKKQIQREIYIRSFLLFSAVSCAALKFLGMELPFLYLGLFVILLVSLALSSDLIANIGALSHKDLINIIEKHGHAGSLLQCQE
jgi:hypothetical protein